MSEFAFQDGGDLMDDEVKKPKKTAKPKFRIGNTVVYNLNGKNLIGVVEEIITENKTPKYIVRGEGGKLTAPLGIMQTAMGYINLKMSEKFVSGKLKPVQDNTK